MADTAVALTAIVVSGVVGPALTALWTDRRQRSDHEHEQARELREVLDYGAATLGRGKRSLERLYGVFTADVDAQDERAQEAFAARRSALEAVRVAEARIAIRLGVDHEVHDAFVGCVAALDDQRDFANEYERGPVSPAALELQEAAHERWNESLRLYLDAARELMRPKLKL